jgi:hypothetical protein
MPPTPREIVISCLTFNYPPRIPRQLWLLPWATNNYPELVREIEQRFPSDLTGTGYSFPTSSLIKGNPYKAGIYIDEWGCRFKNLVDGIIGEVDIPILTDISEWPSVKPPYKCLPSGEIEQRKMYDVINAACENTDKFVIADISPHPWERYQFIRGTENAMIDIMMPDSGTTDLLRTIHEFYLRELELWIKSDVDAIYFADDWGAQNQLLIQPEIWREMFKPLYKEYCDLAHSNDKFAFMHSDGYILDIYEDLIEIGVNAINSQLFCMDLNEIAGRAKGKITFWGEIDRQHILPSKNSQDGRDAVGKIADILYDQSGGIIAQFEFGIGANPETALAIFDEWEKIPMSY